jgi:hypothetical protein
MPFAPAVTSGTRQPPSARARKITAAIAAVILLAPVVFLLPRQVNAVAWLAGAGRPDTFTGAVYGSSCSSTGCATVTYGLLASTGQVVTWPARVPLGKPVALRDPVWDLQSRMDETVGDAVVGVGLGLFFDGIAAAVLGVGAVGARRRRHGARPSAAYAAPAVGPWSLAGRWYQRTDECG